MEQEHGQELEQGQEQEQEQDKEAHSEIGSTHWTQLAHSYLLIARTGSLYI